MVMILAEANHILDELLPKKTKAAERITEFSIVGDGDNAGVQIVADLLTHIIFDLFVEEVWVWHHEGVERASFFIDKGLMRRERLLE